MPLFPAYQQSDISRRLRMSAGAGSLREYASAVPEPAVYATAGVPGIQDPASEARAGMDLPPPFTARNINCGLVVTLPGLAVRQEIVAFRIPVGYLAAIRFIANGLGNSSDSPFVKWSLVVDGGDVTGFSNFIGLIAPAISAPAAIALMLNPGERISWVASNLSGSAIANVSAMFRGWMWSPTLRPAAGVP